MENLDIFKQVGKKVQKIRTLKGLSQVDLVGKMEGNIDTTNISRIESGRTNPTLLTLYRLAQALEVPISELVSFDDAKVEQNKISS
ncbi:helix-turn-helix transcriptional regulator [Capnocytophaga sp. Marseille-Q4570]|uniref:Helix-turn-helix transcriptional regulator n=1 Tax=Capnocytophaga bilenii TaxID=2819369 RepID=A0ABS3PXW2_9FLAO|nr:helix-turn-helix transcriptional regulator [Capnocytophaga bilenii]MBO1884175.1 helix-turn-helix transcriptional regulator [Capnocytophaga bilenii]